MYIQYPDYTYCSVFQLPPSLCQGVEGRINKSLYSLTSVITHIPLGLSNVSRTLTVKTDIR